ncbi:NAD-dependent epimerase/dehydratase family protein [Stenotrophomonas sp. BSUC-16]|uniref:NAD-dependent epimerase/dehydratase family protein n=1 Tax=Stenotrophomonas TaxID=40323 RepID=UPI000659CFFA|nr:MULTISPECIES: NAD-dependent epimerase/dehydratase family protein [Stenotrophomonas maltophilia group]MCO5736513.1 NAD-dependent epimerase/dehydratase family protein [Stenotrophomonas maltophilia]MDT3491612.1 NAD-dependent epimerase/dehydratase family protein [Stenotrophomonas maltophilia group sp. msm4]PZT26609.1 epimerase [Stenotrophomonas maltophilia]CRQ73782.1 NAD dependent epimerase/dehydratase family protein [Pseudomonas aeruginosa]
MSPALQASPLPARVLILGLGWSGRVLAAQLQAHGIGVAGTVRDPSFAPDDGLPRHQLHADTPPSPALLDVIAQADAVLCSVPPDAEGDPALRLLLPALQASPALRWVGYLSSTSVYADRAGGWIDERSAADATEAAGVQRLLAEAQWRALAGQRGIASAVFRLPGLYGPGRNALVQLAQGRARHVVRPGQVFNRLHVDDLATVIIAAMRRPARQGLYLPSDDEPAPPQDVLAFAAKLGGFALPPAVAWDDPVLSPTLRRFYESNKRIDSRGTREALGWQPRFPSYREGLTDLAASLAGHGPALPDSAL